LAMRARRSSTAIGATPAVIGFSADTAAGTFGAVMG